MEGEEMGNLASFPASSSLSSNPDESGIPRLTDHLQEDSIKGDAGTSSL